MKDFVPTFFSRDQLIKASVFSLALGLLLAYGFIPTANHLLKLALSHSDLFLAPAQSELLGFPILALLFALSLPLNSNSSQSTEPKTLWLKRSLLPLAMAAGFGLFREIEWESQSEILWFLVAAPLGEELLFRGWFMNLGQRLWKNSLCSACFPMTASLFFSSVTFALWHLQNVEANGWGFTLIQISYSLILGFWLGSLRQSFNSLLPPLAAHMALNSLYSLNYFW